MQMKGFLISGLAFLLCMVIVVTANYVIYSRGIVQSADYDKMIIDKVNNRAVDVFRIIDDVALNTEECDDTGPAINSALGQAENMMNTEGISFSYSVDAESAAGGCSVKVLYSLESNSFFKEMNYDKII